MSNNFEQTESNQKIWNEHAKKDDSAVAADKALQKLQSLEATNVDLPKFSQEFADIIRQAEVSSKSAALKTKPEEASQHLQNAIKVILDYYPAASNVDEALQKSKKWENSLIENQSAQLVCLRDMLTLLEFVAKVAPSEEINYLNQQVLVLLLELSEKKSSELFALISLIERADYKKAIDAFKVYIDSYCSPDYKFGLDQVITVSTRFLERTIKENDPRNAILALENLFKIFLKDASYSKRMALDMAKAIFPKWKNEIIDKAAAGIKEETSGKEKLGELIQSLLNVSHVGVGGREVKKIK